MLHAENDGFSYIIRPIQGDDKDRLIELFHQLSPDSRYLRFAHAMSKLPDEFLNDILDLDYDREMALVACIQNQSKREEIIGIARYVAPNDSTESEFSLTVSDHYSHHGVGTQLMRQLINYARKKGLKSMVGYILSNNSKMLQLVKELGFHLKYSVEAPEFKIATLSL